MFCSRPCCLEAQRAIFDAFKAGLLDGILTQARARIRAQAQQQRAQRPFREPDFWRDDGGIETAREHEIQELGAPLDE